MSPVNPYRQILRATSLIGASSLAVVLLGILRMKVFAVLLGPAGVGLAGLYTNLMLTAGAILGLGISTSAVREIAAATDANDVLKTRFTVRLVALVLAVAAALFIFTLRKPIAQYVVQQSDRYVDIGWLAFGVAAAILNAAGVATLQGLRRVRLYSLAGIIGTFAGSIASVGIVWWWGISGIHLSVSCIPFFLALAAWLCVDRLDLGIASSAREIWTAAIQILRLGAPLMIAGSLQATTMLVVRAIVTRKFGLDAAGYFHAAILISATYVSFILQSMAGDYFPRLTSIIADRSQASELINHQAQVAMVLALPVILVTIGFSPLIMEVFYSMQFVPAADILKWQVFGDVFKIMAWPIAFIMLSRGASGLFFGCELAWNVLYAGVTAVTVDRFGLWVLGSGYATAYAVYLVIVLVAGRHLMELRLTRKTLMIWGTGTVLASITLLASFLSQGFAYAIAVSTTSGSLIMLYRIVGADLFAGGGMGGAPRALLNRLFRSGSSS